MSHLKSSHSVSLPLQNDSLTPKRPGHAPARRYRRPSFALRGDESPVVELPPLPRWMLNTPINSKFPMIPAPKGRIVLFTTDLCQTLHPSPSGLDFDPSAQSVDSKYQSLHDPHLKNHYWHSDTFERLVHGGFVTPDGKVKCTLKEFNDFQQHLKRVRLEKNSQDYKRLNQIERDEKEQRRYDRVKTADQLARERREQNAQKRSMKIEKERQKRLKQQLDAYDAKHACIITEQQLRREIDDVRRELEEEKRLNHKLQVEKEEREKKIAFLQKRAKEERRRAKMLEEREITTRENRQKKLEEKWDRKQYSKDSRFAKDYLKKQRSSSKMNASIGARKRKLELGWLKQQADLARITEARLRNAADDEIKITASLEKKLTIIRRRFERKLKKLQAMLRSGGIPPVVQLKRTHQFAARKIQWEHQREIEMQLEQEREIQLKRKKERQRARALEREKARAASVPPLPSHIASSDMLPDVTASGHPSWGEVMSKTGISPEKLPPIKSTPEEEELQEEMDKEKQLETEKEKGAMMEKQVSLARDLVSGTMQKAVAKKLVDVAVEKAVASDMVSTAMTRAVNAALQPIESVVPELSETPSMVYEREREEAPTLADADNADEVAEEVIEVADIGQSESKTQPEHGRVKDTPSTTAAKTLALDAIGSACDELDMEISMTPEQKANVVKHHRVPSRATPSDTARALASEALEEGIDEMALEGSSVEGILRHTPSNVGRILAQDAINDAVDEVERAQYNLRQTPSNVGQFLAQDALYGAVDELEKTTEAKLCLIFKDKSIDIKDKPIAIKDKLIDSDLQKLEDLREESREVLKDTPSGVAKNLAGNAIGDAMAELQDMAENFLTIDRVVCRETSSETARNLAETAIEQAADDIEKSEGIQVETTARETHSNVGRKLAKGAIVRAMDELGETLKIYKARKKSFYKSRSVDSDVEHIPKRKPRETRSDVARHLAKGAIESAATDLELEDVIERKTPSNLARDLAESTFDEVAKDLECDPVMHVIYRKTPSNLARILAEDIMQDVADDLEDEGKHVVPSLRKTPSNVARSLAREALVDASQELNYQGSQYALPMPTRKTPSDLGRGLAEGALSDAVTELEREGTPVDKSLRSTPSNIARGLVNAAISDAGEELDRQSPIYFLPKICRKTSSDIARVLAGDALEEVICELKSDGKTVDGKARLTPSNLARKITETTIVDAERELEGAGSSESPTYTLEGKTSSSIAREIAVGALIDGIGEIEYEGKSVEGILRKTPSNLGRVLAQDVIGEALGELEEAARSPDPTALQGTLSRLRFPSQVAQNLASDVTQRDSEIRTLKDEILSPEGADDLEFNEDDLQEMWGNSGSMLASVMDVFSHPVVASVSYEEEDEDEDDNEEVIGILENPLIAEEAPGLVKSDAALTEIVHITDKDEVVVEGLVKVPSDDGPSAAGSVTEAVLSMESFTKNASGQLIRESSSDSSSGDNITKSFDEDNRKGPQYFKLVPLYNDKSIDIGDEVIKSNLSVISIKPDVKMALAGAHQPHSRNSFRNIFRPDMTHCEGSARCLKETLVSQLSQQSNQKVLDECCKVLDEEHPDITARHSDEELVNIGEVEGVCMWPKRRTYQTHVIDEPVPERADEDGSEDGMSDTKANTVDASSKSQGELDAVGNRVKQRVSETQDETQSEQKETRNLNESRGELINESHMGSQTSSKHSGSLLNAVVTKLSNIFSRRSTDTLPQEQHESVQSKHANQECDDVKSKSKTFSELTDTSSNSQTSNKYTVDHVDDSQTAITEIETSIDSRTCGLLEDAVITEEDQPVQSSKIAPEDHSEELINKINDRVTDTGAVNEDAKHVEPGENQSVNVIDNSSESTEIQTNGGNNGEVVEDTAVKSKQLRLNAKSSSYSSTDSNRSSLNESISGPIKKKSGLSVIYVKPADTRLSRSSCTVLMAGKSISHTSRSGGSRDKLKTPEETSHHSPSRKLSNTCSSTTAECDDHHLPVAKVESELDLGLREHMASQTVVRKQSEQTMPTSSHRMLQMTCKLSHSAGELDGRGSQMAAASSELSDQTNKEALWPISRLTSACGSEFPEEGLRTPSEDSTSLTDTEARLSPRLANATGGEPTSTRAESGRHSAETRHIAPTTANKGKDVLRNQTNNSADAEQNNATTSSAASPTSNDNQHGGVLGAIISRVFSFGRRRSNQVVPLPHDEEDVATETDSPEKTDVNEEE